MTIPPVHNHGTEDGPGIGCPERRLPNGRLQGVCMRTPITDIMIDTAMAAQMLECEPRKVRHLAKAHNVQGCYGPHRRFMFRLQDIERLAEELHA